MKKRIIYPAALFCFFALSGCDENKPVEQTTAAKVEHSNNASGTAATDNTAKTSSREEHIKLVKAQAVETFANADASVKKGIGQLADQYLQLKEALVASDAAQAGKFAGNMLTSLQELDNHSPEAAQKNFLEQRSQLMQEQLQQIENSEDLLQQREHFARLTKGITEMVSAFGVGTGSLYYQYCPMAFENKGGYWISDSKEIRNPYYPKEMLKCGRVDRAL